MRSRDFCYWLQGFFELVHTKSLDADQTQKIRAHLAMVFAHEIDPETNAESPDGGKKLDVIHGGQIMPPNKGTLRC